MSMIPKLEQASTRRKPSLAMILLLSTSTFSQVLLILLLLLQLPTTVSSQTLQASFLRYDTKAGAQQQQQLPVSLTNPRLEFLSVSPCDLGTNTRSYPCRNDEIGSFTVRIQSDDDNNFEEALEFRFFGIGGATLPTNTWLQMDRCGWYNVAFSESFWTFASSSTTLLRTIDHDDDDNNDDDNDNKDSTYKFQGSGRLRFQDLTGRPGCNGIESFSVEFQLDRYRYDDATNEMDPTFPAPIFGWISYQFNSTNLDISSNYQEIVQQFELDQARTSVSTMVPVPDYLTGSETPKTFSATTFPITRAQTTSIKCTDHDQNNVTKLYLWLGDDSYNTQLQAPKDSSFQVDTMYNTFGKNNRRHQDEQDRYARVTLEGPNGRGPLDTKQWCSEFEGRIIFRELQVYECYSSCFRANIAVEIEQYCLDNVTEDGLKSGAEVKQWSWASVRYNSTIPPNQNLSSVFSVVDKEMKEDSNTGSDTVGSLADKDTRNESDTNMANISALVEEEMEDESNNDEGEQRKLLSLRRNNMARNSLSASRELTSFQAEFLSLRVPNETIRSTFDGIERLGFVAKRMCAAHGKGYDTLPCFDENQVRGVEFTLIVQADDEEQSPNSRPKKYHVQLFAPPDEAFQVNRWYERVTEYSFDGCQNAHSNIDISVYKIGFTGEDAEESEWPPIVNFGRFIVRELEIRPGCSGIERLAVDIQLHRDTQSSLPVFLFVRYHSDVPVEEDDILARRQEFDLDRFAALVESTSPEVFWANLTQTVQRPGDSSSSPTAPDDSIREISFDYIATDSIYGGCDLSKGIKGFGINLQPEFNNTGEWETGFGIAAANNIELEANRWYAGTNTYTKPEGYGNLGLYAYPCDRHVGAFYIHELHLRDCCALFGNLAVDFVMYCVEPVVKPPVYGWIRFNSSIPIDKSSLLGGKWTVENIEDLANGTDHNRTK